MISIFSFGSLWGSFHLLDELDMELKQKAIVLAENSEDRGRVATETGNWETWERRESHSEGVSESADKFFSNL